MTKLTAEFKSDRSNKRRISRIKKPESSHKSIHNYTNFSGNYGRHNLTVEELSEDLKYAQAVCRQKFW